MSNFELDQKFPPHEARILQPAELRTFMPKDNDRTHFDLIFSDMQARNAQEVFWLKVEVFVLSVCLVGLGALGAAALILWP